MPLSEAQIRRMVSAALACSEGYRRSGEQINWRALCVEQNQTITRGIVYRRTLYGLLVAAVVVGAVGWWR